MSRCVWYARPAGLARVEGAGGPGAKSSKGDQDAKGRRLLSFIPSIPSRPPHLSTSHAHRTAWMHRKIPSLTFSFTKEATATDGSVVASVPLPSPDERPRSSSRSRLRGRSLSPFRSRRSDSAEGIRKEGGEESETDGEPVSGRNAFESSESETESEWDEEDEQLEKNTEVRDPVR